MRPTHWDTELAGDAELSAAEWSVVEIEGELTVIVRESAVEAEPGRLTREVLAGLERHGSPSPPPKVRCVVPLPRPDQRLNGRHPPPTPDSPTVRHLTRPTG